MLNEIQSSMREISALFNNAPDILAALRRSIEENHELRAQAEQYFKERVNNMARKLLADAKTNAAGTRVAVMRGIEVPDVVKNVAFAIRSMSPEHTAFVAATVDAAKKPLLTVMFTEDITKDGLNASALVREAAKSIKGGGGGQPGFAQAGGKDADGLPAAFEKLIDALK